MTEEQKDSARESAKWIGNHIDCIFDPDAEVKEDPRFPGQILVAVWIPVEKYPTGD